MEFLGGVFDELKTITNDVGDWFDETIKDEDGEYNWIGKGIEAAGTNIKQQQSQPRYNGLQDGMVSLNSGRGSAGNTKAASSVNFDRKEQEWLYRMQRFAGLQNIEKRLKVK